MRQDTLYDMWSNRNPQWEKRYEDIFNIFTDYGRGNSSMREDRGKIFGAGYELFIIAFFIGLYYNERRKLTEDNQKRKSFGHPIKFWGNLDSVKGRKEYPELRKYIFISLIAKTDIDFIALEKGEMTPQKAVGMLMQTMEEYANWGLNFIADRMIDDPNFFYKETAFLEVFLTFNSSSQDSVNVEEPESLD